MVPIQKVIRTNNVDWEDIALNKKRGNEFRNAKPANKTMVLKNQFYFISKSDSVFHYMSKSDF